MVPSKVILVGLGLGLCFAIMQTSATLNLLTPRKPLLRYLHRQGLKVIAGKLGHQYSPVEEQHYHHFYSSYPSLQGVTYGVPYPYQPLYPPTILEGGKIGHSQYSVYSPVTDNKLIYDNYWSLPYPPSTSYGTPLF